MSLHLLPPYEQPEDGPDIDCLTCEDKGEVPVGGVLLPFCPECGREPFGHWAELFDDMERGK